MEIRTDLSAGELRALARREKDPRAASRMYAIAHALEGKSRAEAARLSGMERQALHDAVVRTNAEGLAGLHDRPKGRRRPVLSDEEGAALKQLVLASPELARHGRTEWTLPSLAEEVAHLWGKRLHPASLSRVLRRLGLSKQKTRPRHPQADAEAQEAFKRMARPVGKWLDGRWPEQSAKTYPASGCVTLGQDGDPRALVLIKGSALEAI
ncbi:helix-turn-helix domain-containing protein [Rubellimicrobium roseum]|uniref:Helix-turn-helix domain-containing protein n=1 Tax=Rubellimicrobium roseum TaxID=687525 RepID=A0A5C4NB70_9RHOB|nr:helix-turn-helix domain-containing protein [Rubellimicrobium roseum]